MISLIARVYYFCFPVKSESWRLFWSFRTCISVLVLTVLSLVPTCRMILTKNGQHEVGPGFIGFVTIIVKDITLGLEYYSLNCVYSII